MIESVGVGLKEQIKGEQKLTGKSSQLLSDVKIGDVLKGSLTKLEDGKIVLLSKGNVPIPVKLQGMAIFNEGVSLQVLQKDEGQMVLKLLQAENLSPEILQDKIISELGLPKTDAMRQLIETFLAKQMPLEKGSLLKNYHMHQSFQIPIEVLANLSEKTGTISLQEAKSFIELKEPHMAQALDGVEELVGQLQDEKLVQNIFDVLEKYLGKDSVMEMFKEFLNECVSKGNNDLKWMHVKGDAQETLAHLVQENADQLGADKQQVAAAKEDLIWDRQNNSVTNKQGGLIKGYVNIEELISKLTTQEWEKLGKLTKTLVLKALTVDANKLQDNLEESRHIENANKVLKEILKTLEEAHVPEKYHGTLKQLEDMTQVVNKFNMQGEYYFFPLNLPQGEGKGELYFFKPKKRGSGDQDHLYIVLALELPKLKNIEIHMRQDRKSLLLHFKVKEQPMLQLLEAHVKALKHVMGQTKFNLDEIKFSLIEEERVQTFVTPEENMLSHMDFRI